MRGRLILIVSIMFVLGIVAIVVWRAAVTPRGEAIARIVSAEKDGILPPGQKTLGTIIFASYEEYRGNTFRWSAAYYACLFLSAAFSALAGFVIKMRAFSNAAVVKEDLAAFLAMLAALLITLSTVGDFQRKWHANRIAAADTEALVYELIKEPFGEAERAKVIASLQEIGRTRNLEIVGDRPSVNTQASGEKK